MCKFKSKKCTATATVTSAEAGSEEPDKKPHVGNRFSEDESHGHEIDDCELESSYGGVSERLFDKDPLGLERDDEVDEENQNVLMSYPEESDSFLSDDLGLPKELKRAQARRQLYEPMAQSLASLKSLPKMDNSDPKLSDFEQIFGQAPTFVVEKKQPCFAVDIQKVTMLIRFWQCPWLQKMGAFSNELWKFRMTPSAYPSAFRRWLCQNGEPESGVHYRRGLQGENLAKSGIWCEAHPQRCTGGISGRCFVAKDHV